MNDIPSDKLVGADEIGLVADSEFFELEFYLRQRPGLAAADLHTAIEDYLVRGWRSEADPGPGFSGSYYLSINRDVADAGINPLLHYLKYGRNEGRRATPPLRRRDVVAVPMPLAPTSTDWEVLSTAFRHPDAEPEVDVVVPVYRGFNETMRCLFSVLAAKQKTPFRLVVVNDCSPEVEIEGALAGLAVSGLIELHRTPQNLGFVGTCNFGMTLHPKRDVLLLNSDTEVHGNWLDRLRAAALRFNRNATVTPLSNNAEICSYPYLGENNRQQLEVDDETLDRLASIANRSIELEIPTGVGYCMYVRRTCLDMIGLFDVEKFGHGYGEENDLCRRAVAGGWRNILASDVFVRHYGGISFGESKNERVSRAIETIGELHPEYLPLVGEFLKQDPVRPMREALDLARLANRAGKGAMLFVTHSWGGGTEQHVQEMAKLLENHGTPVFFCRVVAGDPGRLQIEDPACPDTPNLPTFDVAHDVHQFAQTLATIGVRHIHVQHLAGMSDYTVDFIRNVARTASLAYDVTLHDYIAICPRIVLVDGSGVYCGEPPVQICEDCIRRNGSPFGHPSVWEWRERYARLLSGARRVFVPDTDMMARLSRFHPTIEFTLRPHPDSYTSAAVGRLAPKSSPPKSDRRRVAVLGAISGHKGSDLLFETARAAISRRLPIDFVVVGYTDRDDDLKKLGNVEITGRYAENETIDRLIAAAPDVVWFPAVWPETFSYTLSAVLAAGMFPIAFDIGALGSRIRAAGSGSLWPMEAMFDPARLAERLFNEPIQQTPIRRCDADYRNPLVTYYDLRLRLAGETQ